MAIWLHWRVFIFTPEMADSLDLVGRMSCLRRRGLTAVRTRFAAAKGNLDRSKGLHQRGFQPNSIYFGGQRNLVFATMCVMLVDASGHC